MLRLVRLRPESKATQAPQEDGEQQVRHKGGDDQLRPNAESQEAPSYDGKEDNKHDKPENQAEKKRTHQGPACPKHHNIDNGPKRDVDDVEQERDR